MAAVSIRLLGPLEIILDGARVNGLESNKVRALLAYLAVERDRPHSRNGLIGLLWPDLPDAAARHNLRQALSNLRQAIGDHKAQPQLLQIDRESIQLHPSADYEIDVSSFAALLASCDSHAHRRLETCTVCIRRLGQAIKLYRGGFLEGFLLGDSVAFEEWAQLTRERLHRSALDALGRLAAYHQRRGAYEAAYGYALRQVELEPWHEGAYRQAMRALALGGQRTAALSLYERCRAVLHAELGVEPEEQTTALYEQIRDQQASGRADKARTVQEKLQPYSLSTPVSISATAQQNLPAQPTPLIGRERELAELADVLSSPDCRLLTILGPGGIGKTRLAIQAAADQLGAFMHGVFFIPLAPLSAAEFLVPAIANALGFAFQGVKDLKEQLVAYLRERELLLLLDNFEHLLDDAELLTDIMQHAPGVTLLVTSRARLSLRAEWLFDLTGLACPPIDSIDQIETYSAARLFLRCARQVRRQFTLDAENAQAVARICQLVEGLPLAIELSAAAVRERSCTAIANAIETAMRVPEAPWRDMPERHRSLRAVFDHSWQLLSQEEHRVLRNLSIFRGGFTQEAAERVADATLPLLATLVDHSLLRKNLAGRYDMHELIRQYAYEQLHASGELIQTCDRHLRYFLELAETAEPELFGSQQIPWLGQLEAEHDNLRAALAWALKRPETETALRLGAALWRFWEVYGHLKEGQYWLERALSQSDGSLSVARARALNAVGRLAEHRGNYPQAQAYFELSLSLFQELGDKRGIANALNNLGTVTMEQGNYLQGQQLYEASLALRRELDDRRGIAASLCNLGVCAHYLGDYARARALSQESVALFRGLGDKTGTGIALNNLGLAASDQGDYRSAQVCFEESMMLAREMRSRGGIAGCLRNLAGTLMMQGCPERAARLFGAAEALSEDLDEPLPPFRQVRMRHDLVTLHAELDEAIFAAAWAEGRAMTMDQAVAEAIDNVAPTTSSR